MKVGLVIGGGRWGRIIATKLGELGYHVYVATDFPVAGNDITRDHISLLNPPPDLIYIASRSVDHERDFNRIASLGITIWIEKNFSGMSDALFERFSIGENFIFAQQLFNTSLDRFAEHLQDVSDFDIQTEVDRPIVTTIGLFDWLCHDLSLIARTLWLRGVSSLTMTSAVDHKDGAWTAEYVINGITFRILLKESSRRFRRVRLRNGAFLISGYDGFLWYQSPDGSTDGGNAYGTSDGDLLGTGLKVALETPRRDLHALMRIVLQLHRSTFPLVQQLMERDGTITSATRP